MHHAPISTRLLSPTGCEELMAGMTVVLALFRCWSHTPPMWHCDSLSFPAFIHIPLRLIFSRSYILTNKIAFFSTCSLIWFWHNVEGPRLIFLLMLQQLCLNCTANIQAISVVLKCGDGISALRPDRRSVSGREDRCRCHEVALVVSWMAEKA